MLFPIRSHIGALNKKIIDSFEQKLINLRGLRGLKVKELRKYVEKESVSSRKQSLSERDDIPNPHYMLRSQERKDEFLLINKQLSLSGKF